MGVALGADEGVAVVGPVPHQVLHHTVHVGTAPGQDGAGGGGAGGGTQAHACRAKERRSLPQEDKGDIAYLNTSRGSNKTAMEQVGLIG